MEKQHKTRRSLKIANAVVRTVYACAKVKLAQHVIALTAKSKTKQQRSLLAI
jgi:hypothetical protein